MDKKLRKKWILVAVLLMTGCSGIIEPIEIGVETSPCKILMAYQQSQFKNTIARNVEEAFANQNCYIRVINLKSLANYEMTNFQAVVVINQYKAFSINRHVKKFLEGMDEIQKQKIILLITAGSPSKISNPAGVDTISSASSQENTLELSDTIIQKVNDLIKTKDLL